MNIFILFPIHLFEDINNLKNKVVYLIEDDRYFIDFKYHKLKLAFHRATMKSYFKYLETKKINVKYINNKDTKEFYNKISKNEVTIYDLGDDILEKKLKKIFTKIEIMPSLNFLISVKEIKENKNIFYKNGKYNFMNFYKFQRKRLNILIKDNKPIGNNWTFDENNRKKLPRNMNVETKDKIINNKYTKEAIEYVNKNFNENYGSLDYFIYPIDHKSCKKWLEDFVKNKFKLFGEYEDAISSKQNFLFHSVISPMLNIGLLTDKQVLDYIMKFQDKIALNSFEGFIRQLIGWRNYMYSIYVLEGSALNKNTLDHNNKLNYDLLWLNKIDIDPIKDTMNFIIKYGYIHHILRLMVLGNFLLLCNIKPEHVYNFYMQWSIDGYEWVMCSNIFGMSQYSDGGLTMTKPYFSSSNYIIKMSNDYKKSSEWAKIFDSLYYAFINKHKNILSKNYSTSIAVNLWQKKENKEETLKIAHNFINKHFN